MPNWIVRYNPKLYHLPRRVRSGGTTNKSVRQKNVTVSRGDRVFLATTGKKGTISARGLVVSEMAESPQEPSELEYLTPQGRAEFNQPLRRVFIDIEPLNKPVSFADIRRDAVLANLPVFTGFQGQSWFSLRDEQRARLNAFIDARQ